MNRSTKIMLLAITAASVTVGGGCKRDDTNGEKAEATTAEPDDGDDTTTTTTDEGAEPVEEPLQTAQALWDEIGGTYHEWPVNTEKPVEGQEPHGAFIQAFYNETAKEAIGGEGDWPNDTIFVKDNYEPNATGDAPDELVAVTAMKKIDGTWFWAKYMPDGSLFVTPQDDPNPGMVVAGTEDLACIDCHQSAQERDHVITKLTEQ